VIPEGDSHYIGPKLFWCPPPQSGSEVSGVRQRRVPGEDD
jgi:hypothetical protein